MAIWYVDPEGGNDGNAGTSFATRVRTLTSGITGAKGATTGDTVRIIGSPAPTSLGQNATWTDGSQTVTLTSAVTASVYNDGAWTAATNVTCTAQTAGRKEGTNCAQIAIAAAFTTGKAAYFATGTINGSTYQQISFWFRQTSGTLATANNISIDLCTDTLGATSVHKASIPAVQVLNRWFVVTVDFGTNLNSAIQSVALYVNTTDQGAQTFQVDNIILCKASSANDSLTLSSLISKNTGNEPWLPIRSINGTTILLDDAPNGSPADATQPVYSGVTETVTLYKRETVKPDMQNSNAATTFGASALNNLIISGGWNRTDMSTQTLDTYLDGRNGQGYGIKLTNNCTVTGVNCVRFSVGFAIIAGNSGNSVTAKDSNGNRFAAIDMEYSTSSPYNNTLTIDNLCNNGCANETAGYGLFTLRGVHDNTYTTVNAFGNCFQGVYYSQTGNVTTLPYSSWREVISITNASRNQDGNIWLDSIENSIITLGKIDYPGNNANAISFGSLPTSTYYTTPCRNNKVTIGSMLLSGTAWGILIGSSSTNNTIDLTGASITNGQYGIYCEWGCSNNKIIGGSFATNSSGDVYVEDSNLIMVGSTLGSTTKTVFAANAKGNDNYIKCQKYGGTANDHRLFFDYGTIQTDTTTRHTASGVSWKVSPTDATFCEAAFPLRLHLANIACASGTQVTVTCYVQRSNTGLTIGIGVDKNQLAGVSATTVTASGSASTWEQLTLTFTPSEAGVIELYGFAYGGSTYNGWFDDLTITQA
jgi:hypothetical protein